MSGAATRLFLLCPAAFLPWPTTCMFPPFPLAVPAACDACGGYACRCCCPLATARPPPPPRGAPQYRWGAGSRIRKSKSKSKGDSKALRALPRPIKGGVVPGMAVVGKHHVKLHWWTTRFDIKEDNVLPVIIDTLVYIPPQTEAILTRIAKDVHDSQASQIAKGAMPRHNPYGHRVRTLAEQVGLAQQVVNARLTLRLIAECATPVVLP